MYIEGYRSYSMDRTKTLGEIFYTNQTLNSFGFEYGNDEFDKMFHKKNGNINKGKQNIKNAFYLYFVIYNTK